MGFPLLNRGLVIISGTWLSPSAVGVSLAPPFSRSPGVLVPFLTSLGFSEFLTYLSTHYSAFSRRVPTVLNTILICFDEVLRLVPGLSDGVVVTLVGDVVLVSRPCWHHITREGFCWQSRYSRASAKMAGSSGCKRMLSTSML